LAIDVRGDGGYFVAPPSLHKSSRRYAWLLRPGDVPLADPPQWLLDWIRGDAEPTPTTCTASTATPSSGKDIQGDNVTLKSNGKLLLTVQADGRPDAEQRAVSYLATCPPSISGAGGHNGLLWAARALVRGFRLSREVAFELLKSEFSPRCKPEWSDAELWHKVDEAISKPFDKPDGWLLDGVGQSGGATADATGGGDSSTLRIVDIISNADTDDIDSIPLPEPPPWPTLHGDALHGLLGELVQAIEPHTEADSVALLTQLLVAFGSAIGRGPHFQVEGQKHCCNLFAAIVGDSSRGRKGTSGGRAMQMMATVDPTWSRDCVAGGLSSGEGLIWCVRDPVVQRQPVRERGKVTGYQEVETDPGVSDKRLLVTESEFAQCLRVMGREGNSLSPIIRQSWDSGTLRTLTKNNACRATDAHISITAHITRPELAKYLRDAELFNGFANRFLWVLSRRSRLLPDGGADVDLSPYGVRFGYSLAAARQVGQLVRSPAARELWHSVYPDLTAERPGLWGAVTGRGEAQCLRLSEGYALLDGSATIDAVHLRAALAVWSYCCESARIIFGIETPDPLVEMVFGKLKEAGAAGLTRTQLRDAFSRNLRGDVLVQALGRLRDSGRIFATAEPMAGRPVERWRLRPNDRTTKAPATDGTAAPDDDLRSFGRSVVAPSGESEVRI